MAGKIEIHCTGVSHCLKGQSETAETLPARANIPALLYVIGIVVVGGVVVIVVVVVPLIRGWNN